MSTSNPSIITQSGAGSSSWNRTPAISTEGTPYVFTGSLTTGDSVSIDVSNDPSLDEKNVLSVDRMSSTGTALVFSTSDTFSTTKFSTSAVGSWKWWRINKTGTAGSATVNVR